MVMNKKNKPLKVLQTDYVVKVNNQLVKVFNSENLPQSNLKLARKFVKTLNLTEEVTEVSICKLTITESIIKTYKPTNKKVLTIKELDFNLEGE